MFSVILKYIKQKMHSLKNQHNITAFDITLFLRQLATLVTAGIDITQCIEILEKSHDKKKLSKLLHVIKKRILAGKQLFYCLRLYPQYFDTLTCQLIQIGEQTGTLDLILINIANNKEKNLALKKRIQQALFYPSFIMASAIIMTLGMFIFVIPRFAILFQDKQEMLPWITKQIFSLAIWLQKTIWFLLFCFVLFIIMIYHYRFSIMNVYLKKSVRNFPLIKSFIHKLNCTRFTRSLSITIAAGLSITESIQLSSATCDDIEFIRALRFVNKKMSSGTPLHHALACSSYFSPLMIQMIKIGEESGKFEHMLIKLADMIDADIDQLIGYLSQLLEPIIMILLGVLIGSLIIALYLPIFKLGSVI